MDLLYFNPVYYVVIYTRCQYAVLPTAIAHYLRDLHKTEVRKEAVRECVRVFAAKLVLSPQEVVQL